MDKSRRGVDNRPENVDDFVDNFGPVCPLCSSLMQRDSTAFLTVPGMIGPRSPTRSGPDQSRSLRESDLLRGYGLDGTDLEGELLAAMERRTHQGPDGAP